MSQLHRRLNDGSAFVQGFEPLLREVLANAFHELPVTCHVQLNAVPDLSIDQMTAVTLLVNEAALNSAKHVFSKGLGARFDVNLSGDETGRLNLTVNDDGPGMGAEVADAQARSLALQLRFEMGAFCLGLMGSSPEGPGDNDLWLNAFSGKTCRDAADFLHRPVDERWGRYH